MLDEGRPTLVVAFPGGRGTADMIRLARHPIPIIITPTLPFGKRLADCWSHIHPGRGLIRLNMPLTTGHGDYSLIADNNTLLHEMVHQCLFERGEDASHKSAGWRS
jgi:hypothetical protein